MSDICWVYWAHFEAFSVRYCNQQIKPSSKNASYSTFEIWLKNFKIRKEKIAHASQILSLWYFGKYCKISAWFNITNG